MFSFTQPIITGNDWFVTKPVIDKSLDWQLGVLIVISILAVATVVYSVALARRLGNSYPVYVSLGAGLATFYEPLGDFLAHVTFHEVGQLNFTVAFGFHVPLWVVPTYMLFFGLPTLLLLARIERADAVTMKGWFSYFAVLIVCAFLFEQAFIFMDSIEYFGANQPFRINKYPVWMAFANVNTVFFVATVTYYFTRSPLGRQRPYLLLPMMPMLVLGGNAGPALPLGSAINATNNVVIVNAMALLSMAASVLYVWICGALVQQTLRGRK